MKRQRAWGQVDSGVETAHRADGSAAGDVDFVSREAYKGSIMTPDDWCA